MSFVKRKRVSKILRQKIIFLRKQGKTLSEIVALTGIPKTTVFYHIAPLDLSRGTQEKINAKKGLRPQSKQDWATAELVASSVIRTLSKRDLVLLLAAIYWGEGTKKELNIINSDPGVIRLFIQGISVIGVKKESLRVSIRVYEDLDVQKVKQYWSKIIGVSHSAITSVEVLQGKKHGRLPYGMCRVRVARGGRYFKIILSFIEQIKKLSL